MIKSDGIDLGTSRRQNDRIPKTTDFLKPTVPAHSILSVDRLQHDFVAINNRQVPLLPLDTSNRNSGGLH